MNSGLLNCISPEVSSWPRDAMCPGQTISNLDNFPAPFTLNIIVIVGRSGCRMNVCQQTFDETGSEDWQSETRGPPPLMCTGQHGSETTHKYTKTQRHAAIINGAQSYTHTLPHLSANAHTACKASFQNPSTNHQTHTHTHTYMPSLNQTHCSYTGVTSGDSGWMTVGGSVSA